MIRKARVVLRNEKFGAVADQAPKRKKVNDPFEIFDAEFHRLEQDVGAGNGVGAVDDSIFEPTRIHMEETTLDEVKQALLLRMDRLEQNISLMFKRVFTEVIALRKENAILKSKVQEALVKITTPPEPIPQTPQRPLPVSVVVVPAKPQSASPIKTATQNESDESDNDAQFEFDDDIIDSKEQLKKTNTSPVKVKGEPKYLPRPLSSNRISIGKTDMGKRMEMPFIEFEHFLKFEEFISEDVEAEQRFVDEFSTLYCTKRENFTAVLWRAVMTDQVAQYICWGGTTKKKSCRDMSVTIALQTAFQRRFDDDGIFVRNSMKFFRYASDRLKKHDDYLKKHKK